MAVIFFGAGYANVSVFWQEIKEPPPPPTYLSSKNKKIQLAWRLRVMGSCLYHSSLRLFFVILMLKLRENSTEMVGSIHL